MIPSLSWWPRWPTLAAILAAAALGIAPSPAPLPPAAAMRTAQEPRGPDRTDEALTAAEVDTAVRLAAEAVGGDTMAIVVVDRRGEPLAVWNRPAAGDAERELALSLARTGAFFSNDCAPLSSRTVRFISSIHFPPGVRNQPNGALYGIENTNRVDYNVSFNPGKSYPPPLNLAGTGPSLGITTGKADLFDSRPNAVNPGGIPIFKGHTVAGGIGVAGVGGPFGDAAEFAAATGSRVLDVGFSGFPLTRHTVIFADGIALPFVVHFTRPPGVPAGSFADGAYFPPFLPKAGIIAPDGYLVGPAAGSALSAAEVDAIIQRSVATAARTRALIRLPLGNRTRMVIAVGDVDGNILGLFRMDDSTIFSIDVAVAKARNVMYFSSRARTAAELPGLPLGTAVSNRSISFGAQPLYPAGISDTAPGPFFPLFVFDSTHPGTQGSQPPNPYQNGIVFFPGSVPLYRGSGQVGGLGVSGDGVDQDDYVAFGGGRELAPPALIRADQFRIRGARIPYLKFPRNPTR